MTNEEKAKELFQSYWDTDKDANSIMLGALKMAEWKDKQFKECLERKKVNLSLRSDLIGLTAPFHTKLINEIINELFEKEKK